MKNWGYIGIIYMRICIYAGGYDGISRFSFKDIFTFAGYKDFKAVGSAKEKIRESLDKFIEHGIFDIDDDKKIAGKFFNKGILKKNYENTKPFSVIRCVDLFNILNMKDKKIRYDVLNFYLYLISHSVTIDKTKGLNGVCCYLKTLELNMKFDFRKVKRFIDILNNMDMIRYKTIPRTIDKLGNWHTNFTVISISRGDINGAEMAVSFLRKQFLNFADNNGRDFYQLPYFIK